MTEHPLRSETADARARLAASPTFAMSLGAKELFHTNTLAFLLESSDPAAAPVQKALREALGLPVMPDHGEVGRCAVWREFSHLDLVIVPLIESPAGLVLSKDRCLVVEAKLKAVPGEAQLERYSAREDALKLERDGLGPPVRFWLRRPASPAARGVAAAPAAQLALLCFDTVVVHPEWRLIAWSGVAAALVSGAASMQPLGRLQAIVADYGDTLTDIVSLVLFARQLVDRGFDEGWTYDRFYEAITDPAWSALRLHDLIGKVAFSAWADRLRAKLAKAVTSDGRPVTAQLESFLTRGKPGVTMDVVHGDLVLGVQLQGLDFRHFVKSTLSRPGLERRVVASPLFASWLGLQVCGQQLQGTGKGAAGALTAFDAADVESVRASNLGVFDPNKFLHSSVRLNGISLADVEAQILAGLALAAGLPVQDGERASR